MSKILMIATVLIALLGAAPAAAVAPTDETGMVPVEPGVDLYYRKIGSGPETLVVTMVAESLVDDLAPLAEGRTVIFYHPRGRAKSSRIDASRVAFENDFKDLEAVRRTECPTPGCWSFAGSVISPTSKRTKLWSRP